jgi:tRNA threonylcarbamoyl adenosine modification protein YeaZ
VLVLGIDTSTPATGVAVCDVDAAAAGLARLAAQQVVDPRHSAEVLTPLIELALAECGRRPADLEAIVAGLGPGPYTSLRVGIVTAAALGDALGIPVHGVCSLDGLVDGLIDGVSVTAVTDARRREVYWARYQDGIRVAGPDVSSAQVVSAQLAPGERVIGAGGELYSSVFGVSFDPEGPRHPDPAVLIRRAVPLLTAAPGPLVPLYQRRPDATPRTAA